jgi:shikimate kinase
MGSGKSVLGKLISKQLNFNHVDSDKLIEKKTNKTINEIFQTKGESYFRLIEENVILETIYQKKLVLSLGGGSILSSKIRKALKDNFLTVFLDVDFTILSQRLAKSKRRPLINDTNIEDKIKALDAIRRKYYLLADITLKNHLTISDAFAEFKKKLTEYYEKYNSN